MPNISLYLCYTLFHKDFINIFCLVSLELKDHNLQNMPEFSLTSIFPQNSLSANPTKWSNTLKQLQTNCLNVFDYFVELVLKKIRTESTVQSWHRKIRVRKNIKSGIFYDVQYEISAWKVSKYGVFFWSVFSCTRTEYGLEKTPFLDTFHEVNTWRMVFMMNSISFEKSNVCWL